MYFDHHAYPQDEQSLRRTQLQLCYTVSTGWTVENRVPRGDLPSVLTVAANPNHYWQRMSVYRLVYSWHLQKGWIVN
jgi:hypothetical protein